MFRNCGWVALPARSIDSFTNLISGENLSPILGKKFTDVIFAFCQWDNFIINAYFLCGQIKTGTGCAKNTVLFTLFPSQMGIYPCALNSPVPNGFAM